MARISAIRAAGGRIVIPASELTWRFVRSRGPGGQHVNRTSSKAIVHFHAAGSPSLPEDVRSRLLRQFRSRITAAGELVITSERFRDQSRNVEDCAEKLRGLIEAAAVPPRQRRATRPTRASVARNRLAKQRRSETKRLRRPPE